MINLLACLPNPKDATSFYRGIGPLSHLRKMMPELNIIQKPRLDWIDWSDMYQADICLIQRPQTGEQMRVAELAKECGTPLWIEYDDDLLNVQKDNQVYDMYSNHETQVIIRYCAGLADVLTVATKHMAEQWAGYNTNIHVINNAIDETRFNISQSSFNKDSKVILWRGSSSHIADLEAHEHSLIELAQILPDWQFVFMGYRPWNIERYIKNGIYIPMLKLMTYFQKIKELRPRIAVVPLADNVFNRTKSNISWIEATYAGANTVGPDWEEWPSKNFSYGLGRSMLDSVLGLIESDQEQWEWGRSMDALRCGYTLSRVNTLRKNIINRYVK